MAEGSVKVVVLTDQVLLTDKPPAPKGSEITVTDEEYKALGPDHEERYGYACVERVGAKRAAAKADGEEE